MKRADILTGTQNPSISSEFHTFFSSAYKKRMQSIYIMGFYDGMSFLAFSVILIKPENRLESYIWPQGGKTHIPSEPILSADTKKPFSRSGNCYYIALICITCCEISHHIISFIHVGAWDEKLGSTSNRCFGTFLFLCDLTVCHHIQRVIE